MDLEKFFETVIEPSIERLGLFGVTHEATFDGRAFLVQHKVSRNVFTEFDAKLSRYIAAVRGHGLPSATVETKIRDRDSERSWSPYGARHAASVPHALAVAGRLALGEETAKDLRVGAWVDDEKGPEQSEPVSSDAITTLEHALEVCGHIGTIEFLELSGDFERVMVRPLGSQMDLAMIDLDRGMITVPTPGDAAGSAWQGPLYGFQKAARQAPQVTSFLARSRHAVSQSKEDAIQSFREAAEARIFDFGRALAGRPLSGYRLERASALISRLQAGLGRTLLGLSEAAQMTALDWAVEVSENAGADDIIYGEADDATRPRLVR